jgi:hypothetical protein
MHTVLTVSQNLGEHLKHQAGPRLPDMLPPVIIKAASLIYN